MAKRPWLIVPIVLAGCGGGEDPGVSPWAYERLARPAAQDAPALAGGEVIVGVTRRGEAALRAYPLAGGAGRLLRVPGSERSVLGLAASAQAVAVHTATIVALDGDGRSRARDDGVPAAFGPTSGPLRRFPREPTEVGVAGSFVLAFEAPDAEDEAPRLTRWDTTDPVSGPSELPLPRDTVSLAGANGQHVAVVLRIEQKPVVVVMDVRTGAERYRVPAPGYTWDLGPDGRLVALQDAGRAMRLVTATPDDPALREVARMALAVPGVSAGPNGAIVARIAANGLAQLVFAGYDGSVRTVTPPLNDLNEFDFDGANVAFNAGECVFAGPIPDGVPGPAPRDRCFDARASIEPGWIEREAQVSGAVLRVRLRCEVPPRAHCRTRLRLRGPGFSVSRRFQLTPGARTIALPIPRRHRRAAWEEGMVLDQFERGRVTAGMVIPQ